MSEMKILIVEDDADLGRALSMRLKRAGFEVIHARDAYQAVQFERRERPDLVLLDVEMPAGNGFRIHEQLNLYTDFCAPVIYTTGKASSEDERQAAELGAAAFLRKPIDYDVLIRTVRETLGLATTAATEG